MRVTLPIANGFYVSDALPISAQRCVNWRPNIPQAAASSDSNLFGTEGITEIYRGLDFERCRGAHVMAGNRFFVISNRLVRLNRNIVNNVVEFSIDELGFIEGTNRVFMADNGIQLCITAPPDSATTGRSYIFTESPDTLTQITDPNFDGPASSVVYINGYFVFHKSDGKKFFNSPLNDGLTGYDPLDFNVAEADPDQIRGLGVIKNQLYVFGSETIQVFRDIARAPSPFAPIPGAVIDVGVSSAQTIVDLNGGLAFVGSGVNQAPSAWWLTGTNVQKISNTAIEREFSDLNLEGNPENLFSWTYASSGAFYFGVSVPNTCYVYDLNNQRWHERQSIDSTGLSPAEPDENGLTRWRGTHVISVGGEYYVGDFQSGNIGLLEDDVYLEYGALIKRIAVSQPFESQGNSVNVTSIEAVVEAGKGLPNDIEIQTGTTTFGNPIFGAGGSDPRISLSWSDDGANIFEGGISRSMGRIGEYSKRPTWNRVGRVPRQRVLRFDCATPTKATLIKAEADIG